MSATRMLDLLQANGTGPYRLVPACALLLAFTAAPIHAQHYQDLDDFGCATGCTPYGRLAQGANGNLYGTTESGGSNNLGTIFMVNPSGTPFTVLWNFDSSTGTGGGGLTLASLDGNFYGTTQGTLFRFNPSTNAFTVLHTFSSTEGVPQGPPVEAKDKNLYGLGGISGGNGTAYRLTVSTETFTLLPKPVPGFPSGPLFLASDGNLYGATANGGSSEAGVVFMMTTAGAIKKLYTFLDESDGATPNAPLTQGKDGNLYGTAYNGGYYLEYGTIFEITLPSDGFPGAYSLNGAGGAGSNPSAGLLAASDGGLYGTTYNGGSNGVGTIFEWQASGSSYMPLFDFSSNGGAVSGAHPNTALMEDTNGQFYGLTPSGGANGGGVFYTFAPANPLSHITLCCNWWVILDQPVTIFGQNLSGVFSVNFGSVPARFQAGSDTYLTAYVPSAAIDSVVTVTLATGLQMETQQAVHILPKITNLDPSSGTVGTPVSIVGGGFTGATKVAFDGVAATNFTVVSPTMIQAMVPTGAKTGRVGVLTPNGSAYSKKTFTVK